MSVNTADPDLKINLTTKEVNFLHHETYFLNRSASLETVLQTLGLMSSSSSGMVITITNCAVYISLELNYSVMDFHLVDITTSQDCPLPALVSEHYTRTGFH